MSGPSDVQAAAALASSRPSTEYRHFCGTCSLADYGSFKFIKKKRGKQLAMGGLDVQVLFKSRFRIHLIMNDIIECQLNDVSGASCSAGPGHDRCACMIPRVL